MADPARGGQQISALEFDEAKETMESKQKNLEKDFDQSKLLCTVLYEMSQILNCGLDQRTLTILAGLIENGVNPEALAAVVKELKRETQALKVSEKLAQEANSNNCHFFRQRQDSDFELVLSILFLIAKILTKIAIIKVKRPLN